MAAPKRFEMTAREKQIEEFYLGVLGRAIAAQEDSDRMHRVELRMLAAELAAERKRRK